jgi:hypothetical protein
MLGTTSKLAREGNNYNKAIEVLDLVTSDHKRHVQSAKVSCAS